MTRNSAACPLSQNGCSGILRPARTVPGEEDAMSAHEPRTSKRIACGDVVPGCTFTASALTEEELLQKVVAHAAHDHGVTEVTPELAAKVKAAIKSL